MSRIYIVFLLAGMLVLPACTQSNQQARPVVTMVLLDVSDSTKHTQIRARYLADLRTVAEATASRKGVILGELVTANPTDEATLPISMDFTPASRVAGKPVYEDAERAAKVEEVVNQAKGLLERAGGATDILSGCQLTDRVFQRFRNAGRLELVIFSDMLQSVGYDFYKINLTTQRAAQIIGQLKRDSRLPGLTGVHVYVDGAGIDPSGKVTAGRNFQVANFWTIYFKTTEAQLDPGDYSGRLIAFP